MLQIGIGDNQNICWIMENENNRSSAIVHNIITSMEYRRFWITWAMGRISLGCNGETIPLVTLLHEFPDLKYVKFGVLRNHNPVEWRLECEFRALNVVYSFP